MADERIVAIRRSIRRFANTTDELAALQVGVIIWPQQIHTHHEGTAAQHRRTRQRQRWCRWDVTATADISAVQKQPAYDAARELLSRNTEFGVDRLWARGFRP